MADGANYLHFSSDIAAVDLDTAIAMLEAGDASETILVDLGEGLVARADGRLGLKGLLQRLRGHRLLAALAHAEAPESVTQLHNDAPEMHPDVAVILDALKNRS